MPNAYAIKDADYDAPEPMLVARDVMIAKLKQCGVHPDSPMGRGVLAGGNIFEDDGGQTFTTPQSSHSAVSRSNGPAWAPTHNAAQKAPAHRGSQPAVSGTRDIGDAVADELDRLLGRAPVQTSVKPNDAPSLDQYLTGCEALGPRDPVTGLRPTQDLGDATAERMAEMQRGYR